MKYDKFPCTKCGCCCKKVGEAIKQGVKFPYRAREDGQCEMLEDNKCKVYDNRPTICNIDSLIEILGANKEDYYKQSIIACNKMMDDEGVSVEYRIKL